MTQTNTLINSLVILTLANSNIVWAADHIDSPFASSDPTADITDFFAWMDADGQHLNLILNVHSFAGTSARFSNAVDYVFHINSSSSYGAPQTEVMLICRFDLAQTISCWFDGTLVIAGDASNPSGILSDDGDIKVFAGLRDDPFFFNFSGFTEAVNAVVAAGPSLNFDTNNCPVITSTTSQQLVQQLRLGSEGNVAADTFAGTNVLSLVAQIHKSRITIAGPLLGTWVSTHRQQ